MNEFQYLIEEIDQILKEVRGGNGRFAAGVQGREMTADQTDVNVENRLEVVFVTLIVDVGFQAMNQIEQREEESSRLGSSPTEFIDGQCRQSGLEIAFDDLQMSEKEIGILRDVVFQQSMHFGEALRRKRIVTVQTNEKIVNDVIRIRIDQVLPLLFDFHEELRQIQVEVLAEQIGLIDVENEVEGSEHISHPVHCRRFEKEFLQTSLKEDAFRGILDQIVENSFVALLIVFTEILFGQRATISFVKDVDQQRIDLLFLEINQQFIVATI